jgi:hypothetical protein
MEPVGSAKIIHGLFENNQAYVYKYVGDGDLSTKKVLRHLWQKEMDDGMTEDVPQ